ncbi:hypothetical protein DFJ74DRAFT_664373 [Hyaloraphidium curvatum]|nr:hypothetical protein DFJ74DRAFT_664373 [Hyaloraphidium curvatum]
MLCRLTGSLPCLTPLSPVHNQRNASLLRDGTETLKIYDGASDDDLDDLGIPEGLASAGRKGKQKGSDVLLDLGVSDEDEDSESQEDEDDAGDAEESSEEDGSDADGAANAVLDRMRLRRAGSPSSDEDEDEPAPAERALGWGIKRSAFYGGDEAAALEDDEARELEEEEVRRLERRRAEWLDGDEEDLDEVFGIPKVDVSKRDDAVEDDGWDMDGTRGLQLDIAVDAGLRSDLLDLAKNGGPYTSEQLSGVAPELAELASEFESRLPTLQHLERASAAWQARRKDLSSKPQKGANGISEDPQEKLLATLGEIVNMKYQLTLNYLASLTYYFLLIHSAFASPSTVLDDPQQHPVMDHLVKIRGILDEVEKAEEVVVVGVDDGGSISGSSDDDGSMNEAAEDEEDDDSDGQSEDADSEHGSDAESGGSDTFGAVKTANSSAEALLLQLLDLDGPVSETGSDVDSDAGAQHGLEIEATQVDKGSKRSKQSSKSKASLRKKQVDAGEFEVVSDLMAPRKGSRVKKASKPAGPLSKLVDTSDLPKFRPLPTAPKARKPLIPADLLEDETDPVLKRFVAGEPDFRASKFGVPLHSVIHTISQAVGKKTSQNDGDADVPRRDGGEKKREREASARGLADRKEGATASQSQRTKAVDMFSDASDEESTGTPARNGGKRTSASDEEADALDYYNSIVRESKKRKLEKEVRAEEHRLATIPAGAEEIDPDSKRATNYAILKNKGLTARKKKVDRNPRLKKRLKYEKMVKKLGSTKRIYRPGDRRESGYKGEGTGIRTDVRKSVKLG